MLLVVSARHPFATRGKVSMAELAGEPAVRGPIVALRRRDAGPPIGAVAGFLETLKDVRA